MISFDIHIGKDSNHTFAFVWELECMQTQRTEPLLFNTSRVYRYPVDYVHWRTIRNRYYTYESELLYGRGGNMVGITDKWVRYDEDGVKYTCPELQL